MIRNTLFAAAAVMLFAVAPAQAGASYGQAPVVEDNSYVQQASHWVTKCKIVRVKTYYGWKNVKKCRKIFPKHYSNSY
jgi:hypothetical protein